MPHHVMKEIVVIMENLTEVSLSRAQLKKRLLTQLPGYAECHQTLETNEKVMPGTAARCLTHRPA